MGKSCITGPFSMAMLNNQRVEHQKKSSSPPLCCGVPTWRPCCPGRYHPRSVSPLQSWFWGLVGHQTWTKTSDEIGDGHHEELNRNRRSTMMDEGLSSENHRTRWIFHWRVNHDFYQFGVKSTGGHMRPVVGISRDPPIRGNASPINSRHDHSIKNKHWSVCLKIVHWCSK